MDPSRNFFCQPTSDVTLVCEALLLPPSCPRSFFRSSTFVHAIIVVREVTTKAVREGE